MDHTPDNSNTGANWFFYLLAALFTTLENLTVDECYTWIFRILSTVSIILIIIINWPKAMAVLKGTHEPKQ